MQDGTKVLIRYQRPCRKGIQRTAEIQIHVAVVKEELGARGKALAALQIAIRLDQVQADTDIAKALRAHLARP